MKEIINYNQTINKEEDTLFMEVVKERNIDKTLNILKTGNVNYFLKNIYKQNSLDFINKLNKKNKEKCYEIINNMMLFNNIIKNEKILENLMFLSSKNIHDYLNIKNKSIVKKLYDEAIIGKELKNPFLLNKIYVLKRNYPNVDENLIESLFQKKSEFFFIKEHSSRIIFSNIINSSTFIKLLNRTNKKDLIFYEEIEKTKLNNNNNNNNEIIKIRSILKNKKIKSFKDIYKVINIFKISKKYPTIKHLKKISYLHNTNIHGYDILIPTKTEDYLQYAIKLNNCLTNPIHFEDLIKNKKNIFFIKSSTELYCIEMFKDKKINIILKKNNFTPTYEEKLLIEKIINLIFI